MKLTTTFLALSSVPNLVFGAKHVKLVVESSDSDLNGKGLNPIHFGGGTNGVLLSDSVQEFDADDQNKVSQTVQTGSGPFQYYFTYYNETMVTEPGNESFATFVTIDGSNLVVNGTTSDFFACSDLAYDPYGYTTTQKQLGVGVYASGAPSHCRPINIKVEAASASNSSSVVASSVSSTPGGNATTATLLETKYTTIPCSTPTTVTYNSKTYTVSSATTLTVEDCGCTETSAPAVASAATSAPIVPANAGVKHVVGAAAGAAILAHLL